MNSIAEELGSSWTVLVDGNSTDELENLRYRLCELGTLKTIVNKKKIPFPPLSKRKSPQTNRGREKKLKGPFFFSFHIALRSTFGDFGTLSVGKMI